MITITEAAAKRISELREENSEITSISPCSSISEYHRREEMDGLRVYVQGGGCSGFQYGLMIEEDALAASDQVCESRGVRVFVDPISIRYLQNAEVDFVNTVTGGGFTIKNPNATSTCGCGSSFASDV